ASEPRIAQSLHRAGTPETWRHGCPLGKWSVTEILAHLAEDELATSWRHPADDRARRYRIARLRPRRLGAARRLPLLEAGRGPRNVSPAARGEPAPAGGPVGRAMGEIRRARGAGAHHGAAARPPHGGPRREPYSAGGNVARAGRVSEVERSNRVVDLD